MSGMLSATSLLLAVIDTGDNKGLGFHCGSLHVESLILFLFFSSPPQIGISSECSPSDFVSTNQRRNGRYYVVRIQEQDTLDGG